jgi:hypothetical protein
MGRSNMKKSPAILWTAALLALLIISGCSRENNIVTDEGGGTPPANVTNETGARTYLATSDPFVQNDQLTIADQEALPTDYGTFGKVDADDSSPVSRSLQGIPCGRVTRLPSSMCIK